MKKFIVLALAASLLSGTAIARGNPNGGGHSGPSAPSPSTPSAPAASGPTDSDGSAGRTNYSMAEDGVARKPASNFCVTWARDAYCAKN